MKTSLALIALVVSLATAFGQAQYNLGGPHQGVMSNQATKLVSLTTTNQPYTLTTDTLHNVQVSLFPDGTLDQVPFWEASGPASPFFSADGMKSTFVLNGVGTLTIKITATSQGHPLADTIVVTITAPVNPPATKLGTQIQTVLKNP